jgi:hypothetical protein
MRVAAIETEEPLKGLAPVLPTDAWSLHVG